MARTLAELTDTELEAQFVEAERNALAWTELGISNEFGSRWMAIAGELWAEMQRRAGNSDPDRRHPTGRPEAKRGR